MTLEEALHAFTAEPAFASFAEDRLGALKPGLRADVTVFDRDLFQTPPAEILKAKIQYTVIDGEVLYESTSRD